MESSLSPAKVVLLAVHFASNADVPSLVQLTATYATILRQDLILRILLTYLPETVKSTDYVEFIRGLLHSSLKHNASHDLDISPVRDVSEQHASKQVRKLHLSQLENPETVPGSQSSLLTSFLVERACKLDEEAGMLTQVPELFLPLLDDAPGIRTFMASTVLPLLRKNYEYYPQDTPAYTLRAFKGLSDKVSIEYLLPQNVESNEAHLCVGRDLNELVGPWLHSDLHWLPRWDVGASEHDTAAETPRCPGWEQVLEWLILQASQAWEVAVAAFEQWDGPAEVILAPGIELHHAHDRQRYLQQSYIRAALASVYSIPESSIEALDGAYRVLSKAMTLLNHNCPPSLQAAAANLPNLAESVATIPLGPKSTAYMRNELVKASNSLTDPDTPALNLLMALNLSAYVVTRLGVPCSVRAAGDLTFLQDVREQKSEASKLIRSIAARAPRNDDDYWLKARRELLWLRTWGDRISADSPAEGFLGAVPSTYIETEFLKALLSSSRYDLAKSIYEDALDKPISREVIRDAVLSSALNAFDNASNPSRTRGGLKKCDEILHALPDTVEKSHPITRRIEALLKATHGLSEHRLVLKQGEPFNPVVLRVHSDPISIIEKVLEQNPKAYTRLQEFLEIGINMVLAGLVSRLKPDASDAPKDQQDKEIHMTEKRIIAMCIEAALREDDFETAYSYVISRLGGPGSVESADDWSFNAALRAGQYIRTERSLKPTHLGTASGNPEIRHLEQRIECLATALRIAPSSRLLDILKSFRRCEEQLDSAIQEEAAKEAAWDAVADVGTLPGAFDVHGPQSAYPPRNISATTAARQTEEAPMSLFDLSRATAKAAQKNLTALSSLQGIGQGILGPQQSEADTNDSQRVRKRDQLRDAATERLVSGVGWLIGANMNKSGHE